MAEEMMTTADIFEFVRDEIDPEIEKFTKTTLVMLISSMQVQKIFMSYPTVETAQEVKQNLLDDLKFWAPSALWHNRSERSKRELAAIDAGKFPKKRKSRRKTKRRSK